MIDELPVLGALGDQLPQRRTRRLSFAGSARARRGHGRAAGAFHRIGLVLVEHRPHGRARLGPNE